MSARCGDTTLVMDGVGEPRYELARTIWHRRLHRERGLLVEPRKPAQPRVDQSHRRLRPRAHRHVGLQEEALGQFGGFDAIGDAGIVLQKHWVRSRERVVPKGYLRN